VVRGATLVRESARYFVKRWVGGGCGLLCRLRVRGRSRFGGVRDVGQLACLGIVRRRRNGAQFRTFAEPPPLVPRPGQRATCPRAGLIVRARVEHKRASAHKALIRMKSVELMWGASKSFTGGHPMSFRTG